MGGEILEKMPKKTPAWALGITTVIVSTLVSVSSFYILSKDEVKQMINWSQKHHDNEFDVESKSYTDTLSSVLNLVQSNSEQIVQLSQSLGATQQQNVILTDRVFQLEKKVDAVTSLLQDCEDRLKICTDKQNTK